jgi:polar amino acid transport system substrate-binding protein
VFAPKALLCLSLLYVPLLLAEESLPLYIANAPPLTQPFDESGKGMVGDVVLAALKRAGYGVQLKVEPWARAQVDVSRGTDLLIAPQSRIPQREAGFTWIAEIMPLERAFFTLDPPLSSFAEARRQYRKVAIARGTAQEQMLLDEGFSQEQIVDLQFGESPLRMLKLGRVDAWFTSIPEGLRQWPESERTLLQVGPTLASSGLYLACSKRCDETLVRRLRESIESLRREGELQRILQRYWADLDQLRGDQAPTRQPAP